MLKLAKSAERPRLREVAAMFGHLHSHRTVVQASKDASSAVADPPASGRSQDSGSSEGSAGDWLEAHLRRWQEANILDEDQVRRILTLERAEEERRPAAARPGLLEAFVYLGLVVACVGIIVLTAQHWDELRTWARIASLAVPALLALALGGVLRTAVQPELHRAVAMAWLAAVALGAGAVGVAGAEAGWAGADQELAAGAGAVLLALTLWGLHRAHPQVIALAGSLVLLADAVANHRPDAYGNPNATIEGMLLLACGAVALVLTEAGLFTPRVSARAAAAAGLVWGPFIAGYAHTNTSAVWAQPLVFLTAGLLVALSLQRASFTYMLVGVAGLFLGLVTFILKHFEAQVGAPVALMLSGALLVAAALLLARFRARLHRLPSAHQQQ